MPVPQHVLDHADIADRHVFNHGADAVARLLGHGNTPVC